MDQTELSDEQKGVVRRYLEVWRCFRRIALGKSAVVVPINFVRLPL